MAEPTGDRGAAFKHWLVDQPEFAMATTHQLAAQSVTLWEFADRAHAAGVAWARRQGCEEPCCAREGEP